MKKVTYLFAMFLAITLMNISCSKDVNDNTPIPNDFIGKWSNVSTTNLDGTAVTSSIPQYEFEFTSTTVVITAKNNTGTYMPFGSWSISGNALTLSDGSVVTETEFTIVGTPTAHVMVLKKNYIYNLSK